MSTAPSQLCPVFDAFHLRCCRSFSNEQKLRNAYRTGTLLKDDLTQSPHPKVGKVGILCRESCAGRRACMMLLSSLGDIEQPIQFVFKAIPERT
jgi:hypothetical protein